MDKNRDRVIALLKMGKTVKEISERLKIPTSSIYVIKQKYEKEVGYAEEVETLNTVDSATLVQVVDAIKAEAPEAVKKDLDKVVAAKGGLEALDAQFQATATKVLLRAELLLEDPDMKAGSWNLIAQGMNSLYTGIFNKNVVNMQVNNNQVNNAQVSMFKDAMRSV